ncbi:MFS transporter [Bacillus sp. FJAT-22090]|uniref:MFS transporter n=1 Tax=Bacillus sp. FJAT-22090 TaxID=1581038 RepID=UPI0006AF166D|nr:MFS transporter [Bacillus sp. FJAT-22090]ALC85170.1 MFS transporter [Bacillus sp. FJAT-22090]
MPAVIYVLAFAIFSMTTSEFMVAGMMPELAEAFSVSISSIGFLITAFAASMVLGGPILTAILLKIRSKQAILVLIIVFFIGQTLGALSWNYEVMMVARIITGTASSATFGIAISLSASLVGSELRGRAVSVVLAGLMISMVVGLPVTTFISQELGWRVSFWAVALLVFVAGIIILSKLPSSPAPGPILFKKELEPFRNRHLWAAYVTSTLIIGGTFAGFSFFTSIFTDISGFSESSVPLLLSLYGGATVIGNILIGRYADRFTMRILFVGLMILFAAMMLFAIGAETKWIAIIAILLIGLTGVSLNPAMATRVMKTAGSGTMINTVHSSFITLGVVIGSSLGGVAISGGYGLHSPLWIGAILAALGLLSLLPYSNLQVTETKRKN